MPCAPGPWLPHPRKDFLKRTCVDVLIGEGAGQAGEEGEQGRLEQKAGLRTAGDQRVASCCGGGGGCCQHRADLGLVAGAGRAWGREVTAGGFWLRI